MLYGLKELKKCDFNFVISRIELANTVSIKLHEKNGFKFLDCNWNEFVDGFLEIIYVINMTKLVI